MLKIINKYKLGIIGFSILLSGCSTSEIIEYNSVCNELPDNFIDKKLEKEYNQEKNLYIKDDEVISCSFSYRCEVLKRDSRWDTLEIYLKSAGDFFPYHNGYYQLYRDYKFEKCISKFTPYGENRFLNDKGEFCIAYNEIKKPTAKIKFQYETKKLTNNKLTSIEYKVYVSNKLFLSVHDVLYSTPSSSQHCVKKDEPFKFILNNFN